MHIPIIIILILIILLLLYASNQRSKELFSSSGLSLSNQDCEKLVYSYILNKNKNTIKNICGINRRKNIDNKHGNYYMVNGMLL